ncbi:hypothetical protein [Stenotrophomonas sp. 278]|uniref:hypothetical protein n=1 Tax=Stenotrophomonas sp. 278 TaxID=2479851 RepID=UPI000F6733A8|nr:hypothetical protein [Stenotrophomonas sp. 278]RRU13984.1 hypothetical protein EGJ34_10740 [Stenotrophomonas sp. 278]
MTPHQPLFNVTAGLLVALLMSGTAVAAEPAGAPAYVDLVDYPTYYAQGRAFNDLKSRLHHGFGEVCPDTLCEGEFTDYQPLKLRCAVEVATGTVSECRWAFAASELDVDPATGQVGGPQPRWLCALPIPAGTAVPVFFAALEGPRAIFQTLPGARQSVFEAIADCVGRSGAR